MLNVSAGNYVDISLRHCRPKQLGHHGVPRTCRSVRVPGRYVNAGDALGAVSTGYATGCHLHSVFLRNGNYVEPMDCLNPG